MTQKTNPDLSKELFKAAQAAQQFSYSPYSKHQIGAALVTSTGQVYSGCNIENASYGATVCAERVAIWKALSENSQVKISAICVVSDSNEAWPPCGLCRQVLSEFSSPESLVFVANQSGIVHRYKFSEILPHAFTPNFLGTE